MRKIDIAFVNFNWKIKHFLNSSKLSEYKLLLIVLSYSINKGRRVYGFNHIHCQLEKDIARLDDLLYPYKNIKLTQ
jgi:hypothetical protein